MNKIKTISMIAIGLLISNLALVGFIMLRKPKHPLGEGPKKLVIEKLHFDDKQVEQYEVIIQEHQKNVRKMDNEIIKYKNALYQTLTKSANVNEKDSLINQISKVQKEIETIHFNHFLEIKKLCKPEQEKYFEDLTKEIEGLFYKRQMPKEKREK